MTSVISELLERGIPEPASFLDPDELLVTSRRRVTNRRLTASAAVAAAVVAAVIPHLALQSPRHVAGAVAGVSAVSALDHATPLPAQVSSAFRASPMHVGGTGVLAAKVEAGEVFLAAAVTPGEVCLILYSADASAGMSCGNPGIGVYLADQYAAGYPVTLSVVMPDGYTTLTSGSLSAIAHDNVAVLTGDVADTARIRGKGVPPVRLHVGPFLHDDSVPAVGTRVSPPAGFPAGVSAGRDLDSSLAAQRGASVLTAAPATVKPKISAVMAYAACTTAAAICPKEAAPTLTLAYADSPDKPLDHTLVWALSWIALPCPVSEGREIDDKMFSLSPQPTPVSCRQLMLVDATSGQYLFTLTGG